MHHSVQTYWRAEVYKNADVGPGKTVSSKLFAGIYASRKAAEQAAQHLCKQVRGFGFYIHVLGSNR